MAGSSGWYGLLNVLTYRDNVIAESRAQFPQACPNDGEPVRTGPDDSIYCSFCHWRWDGTEDGAFPPVRR
jgi:hypothetical protein